MTVYELIQELSRYDADEEVEINVVGEEYTVSVTTDTQREEDEEFDTDVDFDEDVTDFDVDEYKHWRDGKKVRITVELN